MRLAHRPFLIMLLTAGILSLWTGGNAWHAITCGLHDHGRSDAADSACSHSTCCHHSHGSPVQESSDTPLAPDHDHDSCPVCQWYTLHHASVISTVELESTELLCTQAALPAVPLLSGELVRYCQPRAPPESV
ncbi:hypothetical protein [Rubinisphaera margarita]|uniref:hypothetical protein n=1 Tax=Rubinisphaera margarita TaxID=2909586 RepID=UPI001EE95957|nr:hypothetical protein [Rubinisphaera margarita]MCG6158226.1 hypothetical protein [Rubinisphaera margarita]